MNRAGTPAAGTSSSGSADMFERFTDRARRVVVLAQEKARMRGHNYVGTEHILLGLIDEECLAVLALKSLGIALEQVRHQVEEIIGQGQHTPSGHIPFTPRTKKVLELSLQEAQELGHNYIGTEHILLGLIHEGEGVGGQVLVKRGADLSRVRQEVLRMLSGCVVCHDPKGFSARMTGSDFCRGCKKATAQTLRRFQEMAPLVLRREGPGGLGWATLVEALHEEKIPVSYGLSLIREDCESHLERVLTFCFSDGRITQEEVNVFNELANSLQVRGQVRDEMQSRIARGLLTTNLADGQLPSPITPEGVQPQLDERFYLDIPARYQRVRKSGNQLVYGRVLVSSAKFRFIGERSNTEGSWGTIEGWELSWNKILRVDSYNNGFDLCPTQKKGSGFYFVDAGVVPAEHPVVAAELMKLLLRIASRQSVASVSNRDSRKIPQEVKNAVYARDGGRCQECHARTYIEFDHIIPLSMGGASSLNNLQLLCRRCNGKKGGRI